jgi:carboxymethylenebutenolidase
MNYFQKYLVEEFAEDYQEGHLTRRDALKLIGAVTGSLALASSILAACSPPPETPVSVATSAATITATPTENSATDTLISEATDAPTDAPTAEASPTSQSVNVSPDDPTIQADEVQFPSQEAMVQAYLARPASARPDPVVLVCHENRGLTDHIRDVARRLAKAGYVALAVDLLSKQGGTAKVTDPAQIPAALSAASPDELAGYYLSGIKYLQGLPFVQRDRLGMVGFCFGGGMTWLTATKAADLKAAVPFYGPNPPLEGVPNIKAAVLAIYGENDARINAGIPAIEEAMKKNAKTFEKLIYPGAGHAFHNDTGRAYNPQAAEDAWKRTLEWFARYVKGG